MFKLRFKPGLNFINRNLHPQIEDIRKNQWKIYKDYYKKLINDLDNFSYQKVKVNTEYDLEVKLVSLDELGRKLKVSEIKKEILVPEDTFIAEMCCIDEGAQTGEFIDEETIGGIKLGTICNPKIPRYIIDLPGSGALALDYNKEECNCETEKVELQKIAGYIADWCKNNKIIKFTVTYHQGCGAIQKRINDHPELCSGDELEVAKSCAKQMAATIESKALEIKYPLEVTVAYISSKQMNAIRPIEMHNAIGTAVCLDPSVKIYNFDQISHANFFDIFGFCNEDETVQEKLNEATVKNVELSIAIASGKHGWGTTHFEKNSYPIIIFAANTNHQQNAIEIFKKLTDRDLPINPESLELYVIRTDL